MEIELRRLIGYRVVVIGPSFVDNEKLQSVKLLAVEDAGIWIESREALEKVIAALAKRPTSADVAFFIPLRQITTIMAGYDPAGIE